MRGLRFGEDMKLALFAMISALALTTSIPFASADAQEVYVPTVEDLNPLDDQQTIVRMVIDIAVFALERICEEVC